MKQNRIKHIGKTLQNTIVILLKMIMFLMIFLTFYLGFARIYTQMLRISRTSAVTTFMYLVVGWAMVAAYGTYDIGKRKSKPIIYSLGLASIITDIVVYIQLMIMNTNEANNLVFKFEYLGVLCVIGIIQIVEIIAMAYFGNYVFFKLNEPEKCCVVTSSQFSLDSAAYAIKKFKKQHNLILMTL